MGDEVRDVHVDDVSAVVERLFVEANTDIGCDMLERLKAAAVEEVSPTGREVLAQLIENARLAGEEHVPLCQDTGIAVLFFEIGQDVHFTGGSFSEAVARGVRDAYVKGYLRKSCCDPFSRKNTGDNTPPIIHVALVEGSQVRIIVFPKGGGSENCSEVRMLTPSEGIEGVVAFVVDVVRRAGPNPCPPVIVGVGIGGNFETSALLSKEALMIPLGQRHDDPLIAGFEKRILGEINQLGIGPGGYGGVVTALDVHIKLASCHIASLPVAVNVQCHAHRIREARL
jgi:fumarate hydratase subunit alpha